MFVIVSLWVMGLLIILLSVYLNEVVPKEFGVAKHPLFCIRRRKRVYFELESGSEFTEEDDAVKQEREQVYQMQEPYTCPLVVKDLTKRFPGKVAVNSLCLNVKENELFGLLGPNGAGKTTLISMLTGLHKPDSGHAWISGSDIASQLDVVQLQIGVCPQFDILWPNLTVEQHLLFYARLKGVRA